MDNSKYNGIRLWEWRMRILIAIQNYNWLLVKPKLRKSNCFSINKFSAK